MSKVIEIIDSDDDSHDPRNDGNEAVPPHHSASSEAAVSATQPPPRTRKNRRKSLHRNPKMPNPEIEFETIALEDDEDDNRCAAEETLANASEPVVGELQQQRSPKTFRKTPKILVSRSQTTAENVITSEEFVKAKETSALLSEIAEERVRINYLLSKCGMPEINFSLYTQPERLRFQLEERLKQRKIRNWDPVYLQDAKKRRSLLQSTASKDAAS